VTKKKAAPPTAPDGAVLHLGDLLPDPQNARKHTPRNIGLIEDALQEVGAARSIVIDENNVVLAGNGTIEAAGNIGIENVRVIDATGDEIIAVRRSNLTEAQKTRLKLFDNRSAELAEWDAQVLADLAHDGTSLVGLFSDDEIEILTHAEWNPPDNESLDDLAAAPTNAAKNVLQFTDDQMAAVRSAIGRVRAEHGDEISDSDAVAIACRSYGAHQ
jgi:hypothetical protein